MTLLSREAPELPPELLFTDVEIRVLRRYAMKRKAKQIHTLKDAVTWTAILGGYQNRTHDPQTGADLTWYTHEVSDDMRSGEAIRTGGQNRCPN